LLRLRSTLIIAARWNYNRSPYLFAWVTSMRVSSRLLFAMMLILVAVAWPASTLAAPNGVGDDLAGLARRAVDLANQERVKAGLDPLMWNDQLASSATGYAQQMAAGGFFTHNAPDGSTPVSRAQGAGYPAYGWGGIYVGENLGRGYNTAESVTQAWMNSEGHRANLLLPKYREIGIGLAVAPDGTKYWAQEFGSRPKALPVFIDNGAASTDSPRVDLTITDEEVSPWGSLGAISSMMVSNRPDFAGSFWEPFAKTRSWTLAAQPGPQTVFVRLKDVSGQTVDSSASIQYDGRQALGIADLPLVATILSVWPRDGLPVALAPSVNVSAHLAVRDTGTSVPPDFSRRVLLLESLNGGPDAVAAAGLKRPDDAVWDFNNVDVSRARQAGNSYRFRVAVDGADTQSSSWDHHQ
jgi:uncharacterized protein YkwD